MQASFESVEATLDMGEVFLGKVVESEADPVKSIDHLRGDISHEGRFVAHLGELASGPGCELAGSFMRWPFDAVGLQKLDKAAARGVIHPNTAARKKSQIARLINAKSKPAAAPAPAK